MPLPQTSPASSAISMFGRTPTPTRTRSAGRISPSPSRTPVTDPTPQTRRSGSQPHIRPGLAVDTRVERADFGAGDAGENLLHRLQDRNFETQLDADGGGFEPIYPAPITTIRRAGRGQLFQLIDIGQGAEFGDVFEVGPRQAQLARPRACGDHQLVPVQHLPTGQRDLFRGEVDRGRRLPVIRSMRCSA